MGEGARRALKVLDGQIRSPVENWKASDLRMLPTSATALGWPPRCLDLSSKGTAVEAEGREGDLPGRRPELPFLTTSP